MSSQLEDAFNEAVQRRAFEHEHQRILALLDSVEAEEAVVNALMRAVEAGADLGSEARTAITALVGLVESDRPTGKTGSVSYRVRDRDSDYKAMCHEDRDHAELLLKAWLADGRDALIESRVVYDAGWRPDGEDRP